MSVKVIFLYHLSPTLSSPTLLYLSLSHSPLSFCLRVGFSSFPFSLSLSLTPNYLLFQFLFWWSSFSLPLCSLYSLSSSYQRSVFSISFSFRAPDSLYLFFSPSLSQSLPSPSLSLSLPPYLSLCISIPPSLPLSV